MVLRNIQYSDHAEGCLLDVFPSASRDDGAPIVLCVHGGGWIVSDKSAANEMAEALQGEGFCVVTPSYRLSSFGNDSALMFVIVSSLCLFLFSTTANYRTLSWVMFLVVVGLLVHLTFFPQREKASVKHPAHVQDLAKAVRWCYLHGKSFGGDPNKIVLLGHSAGGHLTTLLANDLTYVRAEGLPDDVVKASIGLSGVYSYGRMLETQLGKKMVHLVFGEGDDVKDAFPIYHVHARSPPHLLLNGELDFSFKRHTMDMYFRMLEIGCYVKHHVVHGQTHFSMRKKWKTTNAETLLTIKNFLEDVLEGEEIKTAEG